MADVKLIRSDLIRKAVQCMQDSGIAIPQHVPEAIQSNGDKAIMPFLRLSNAGASDSHNLTILTHVQSISKPTSSPSTETVLHMNLDAVRAGLAQGCVDFVTSQAQLQSQEFEERRKKAATLRAR